MNLPNRISLIRLLLIPVFVAVFYVEFPYHYQVAAFVFAAAAFTDFLDGYIARKYSLVTDLGKFLDSSADKVLVLGALVLMLQKGVLPDFWDGAFCVLILAREITISCLRMIAAAKGVVMAADKLGKIKTILQDVSIAVLIGVFGFASTAATVIRIIGLTVFYASVIMTVVSGVNYFYVNRRVLTSGDEKDK